jgi:hypothetical protein
MPVAAVRNAIMALFPYWIAPSRWTDWFDRSDVVLIRLLML